ncbi:MAG: hypothetical protein WDN28_21485 [Chthoniobacter sp.]
MFLRSLAVLALTAASVLGADEFPTPYNSDKGDPQPISPEEALSKLTPAARLQGHDLCRGAGGAESHRDVLRCAGAAVGRGELYLCGASAEVRPAAARSHRGIRRREGRRARDEAHGV